MAAMRWNKISDYFPKEFLFLLAIKVDIINEAR